MHFIFKTSLYKSKSPPPQKKKAGKKPMKAMALFFSNSDALYLTDFYTRQILKRNLIGTKTRLEMLKLHFQDLLFIGGHVFIFFALRCA